MRNGDVTLVTGKQFTLEMVSVELQRECAGRLRGRFEPCSVPLESGQFGVVGNGRTVSVVEGDVTAIVNLGVNGFEVVCGGGIVRGKPAPLTGRLIVFGFDDAGRPTRVPLVDVKSVTFAGGDEPPPILPGAEPKNAQVST